MAGRPQSTKDYFKILLRIPPDLQGRIEHCHALLQRQHGPKTTQTEALWRLLDAGCAALEGQETPAPISEMSALSQGTLALHELAKPVYLIDEGIPFDEDLAPASHTNGTGAPQPPTQPAIPLALEPAPKTAHPVPVPQASEKALPRAAPGMTNCDAGKGHPPYPITMSECPTCRKARNARDYRARKKAKLQG